MAVVASFIADITVGSIPFTVSFTDTSTGAPDRWWWDFGDGEVGSESQNPSHTYLCVGDYTVTLTAWVDDGESSITATIVSTLIKSTPTFTHNEVDAWTSFLDASYVSSAGGTSYSFSRDLNIPVRYAYREKKAIYRLDLSGQVKGDNVILLQYHYRFLEQAINCSIIPAETTFWWSNDRIGDIPIFKWAIEDSGGVPVSTTSRIQMISSPDLSTQFDHAGEIFDIQVLNGKTRSTNLLFESELLCVRENRLWQRIGFSCEAVPPSPPTFEYSRQMEIFDVKAIVKSFTSIDSTISVNFITANSNMILRPPVLFSGIKEAYFKDGWENEKHIYIEQSKAQPCTIQFVDIYADTENE